MNNVVLEDTSTDTCHLRFTAADLATVRVVPSLGRAPETALALELLARTRCRTGFEAWQRAVHGALTDRSPGLLREMLTIGRQRATIDALLSGGLTDSRVVTVVREFHEVAVAPYWAGLMAEMETERDTRCRVLPTGGLAGMLESLHPRMEWCSPDLAVPCSRASVDLDGRGILVAPSPFLTGTPRVIVPVRADRPVALVYPVTLDRALLGGIWSGGTAEQRSLGPLLGRTRAAVLAALTDTRASVELSRALDISSAAVSQHTSILRAAGLISSQRTVNALLHTLTPLGAALLRGSARG
ncbi:winged helix-turn-helix domain-containing protein [Actinokineospora enzanensis]|uniref:winged helix-turn-helix domain-containing protein n=1 Tax=Actinokineospora enzanensis TaxID=155975 RepID=UPI0003A2466F|nr:winged helix-turn-helix domain-containing protein [Actinokineospora enzanensis]